MKHMRISTVFSTALAGIALFAAGCAGPEQKLGRGISNATEFARLGEMRSSMETTCLWEGSDASYTTGVVRGFNKSVARTVVGACEIATFPVPSYDPMFTNYLSVKPRYPESYRPRILGGADTNLGFAGGDILPLVPGSRFYIFEE